jgi:glycosyltransferase involved in cell wall biosynthesis
VVSVTEGFETVAVVTNIPTPYRTDLFNEMERQLRQEGRRLLVIFASPTYERRHWAAELPEFLFHHVVLGGAYFTSGKGENVVFSYRGLGAVLRSEKPSIVIVSGFSPATMRLWLRSFFVRAPFLIWSGETNVNRRARSLWRRIQRRLLVSRAGGFIAYGTDAKKYLEGLGAPTKKILVAFNTVDIEFFRRTVDSFRDASTENDSRRRLLTVSYLTKGKRIDLLLGVMAELSTLRKDVTLEIVGEGPERTRLEKETAERGLSHCVRFHGNLDREGVARVLAKADAFLFPSGYDIWGLVVVEAMAAGVPCFASPLAGATTDLVTHERTGFVEDFRNAAGTAARLHDFLSDRERASRMGRRARELVEKEFSLEKSARGFIRAVDEALDGGTTHRPSPR